MLESILGILFPKLCIGCNASLVKNEQFICTSCTLHLPVTDYHLQKNNPLEKTFWGRAHIEQAFSFLHFKKGNITQHLLHELKYKGNKDLGVFIGNIYGSCLKDHLQADAVASIPLHQSKLRKRGYNQSDFFAEGIAKQLDIENISRLLKRKKATETQTRKSRFERWENVEEIFEVETPEYFANRHILLVDDVITTGATIESCLHSIYNATTCRLSVASIAVTSH